MEKIKDFTHGGNIHRAAREIDIPRCKILDFSANINPLGLSSMGKKSIRRSFNNILHYPDPDYNDLKESISRYYSTLKEFCLLGNGAIELIYTFIRLKAGGRALIPAPGFVEYEKALISCGWEVDLYRSKSDIDLDGVDLIFFCNPNNPTGESYSERYLLKLLNSCREKGVDLFLDEAFIEYSSYNSMSKYLEQYDNLYILKSLTKFFAIPGLRLGSLLTSNRQFINSFNNQLVPWSINSVAEDYIKAALKDRKYIKKSKEYIRRERYWLYKRLGDFKSLKVYRSQGNYLLFKSARSVDLIGKLRSRGILIRCCSNYNGLDSSYYRVAVKSRNNNNRLIKTLSSILNP